MTDPSDGYDLIDVPAAPLIERAEARPQPVWGDRIARLATAGLCWLQVGLIWIAMGGREGFTNNWPLLQADHGLHYHHGVMTRNFLRSTGWAAGYDPSFMAGFPMSAVSGTSSTLSNLVVLAFPADRAALAMKVSVLGCVALGPWLVAMASALIGSSPIARALSVFLYLIYFWTDFPCNYAALGMTTYLLSIPVGLIAIGSLSRYFRLGGLARWFGAAIACSLVFLVHLTSPMIVGPAGLLAYGVAVVGNRREGGSFPISRHLGILALVPVILGVNAFWWLPAYWLISTAGASDMFLSHPESVMGRLGEIFWVEAPIESVTIGLGLLGLVVLARRDRIAAASLGGFLAAGFGWGYLAGAFRALDSLQPGRHTYACYSAACVLGGVGLSEVLARLRSSRIGRLDWVVWLVLILVSVRVFGPSINGSIRARVGGPDPFLSSQPTSRMVRLVEQIRKSVSPGERLLFEETGLSVEGLGDPFGGRHLSPVLPTLTGVEVLGGPYLHIPLKTNFTQFGESALFGNKNWNPDWFKTYARLYRPSAIVCWSPKARAFCRESPDLIKVVEDDGLFILGRVLGFEGAAIRGQARVQASPNRLVVTDTKPDVDGLVVLRYHVVPNLRAIPPTPIEPIFLEGDPVPFIGFRPTLKTFRLEMVLPSWGGPAT